MIRSERNKSKELGRGFVFKKKRKNMLLKIRFNIKYRY